MKEAVLLWQEHKHEWETPSAKSTDSPEVRVLLGDIRRKMIFQREGGFYAQVVRVPPGFTNPLHTHDYNELMVIIEGSCEFLGAGLTAQAGDTAVIFAHRQFGYRAGPGGLQFMTIHGESIPPKHTADD